MEHETGAIPKTQVIFSDSKKKMSGKAKTPKQLTKFRKMAAELKLGIERPEFNLFPTKQDLMKKQGKRML